MCKNLVVFILFYIVTLPSQLLAQSGRIPLKELLHKVEQDYNVRFTFADDVIQGVNISPIEAENLEDVLQQLRLQTGLQFEAIQWDIIAISPKQNKPITLKGYIKDSQSHEMVPFATIQVGSQITTSDVNGQFQLENVLVVDSTKIIIGQISYFALEKNLNSIDNPEELTISLRPKYEALSEVIIDNYFVPGISRVQGGGFRFTPNEQQILPGLTEPDLLFSLQTFPGIYSANESVSNINIRGGTNDQNLVLWDGIRMFQTGHFFGLISAFNPYITESATVVKNGTTSDLGQGVSGTLDMKLKETVRTESEASGGVNLLHANLQAGVPITKNISIELAARRSLTDLWQSPTYDSYFDRAFQNTELNRAQTNDSLIRQDHRFLYYDWLAKVNYQPNTQNKLSFTVFNIADELSFAEETTFDNANTSKESLLNQSSKGLRLSYTRFWSQKIKSKINLYQSEYELDATNQYLLANQTLTQSNKVTNRQASITLSHLINSQLDWQWGYSADMTAVTDKVKLNRPSLTSDVQRVLNSHIVHGQANWSQEATGTFVSGGLRLNYFQQADPQFILEPRLRAHQYLTDELMIEFLGELKSQTITQIIDLQSDFLGVERRRWALADGENFPIIRSKQASLGLHYELNDFFASGEFYVKQVNNIISTSQAFQNQLEFIQVPGSYDSYGLDFMIKRRFGKLNSWLSYGWAHTNYTFDQTELDQPSFPSNLDIRHNIYLGNSLKTGQFDWSLGANYHSGVPVTRPDNNDPVLNGLINYQSPNHGRLPDYLRLDFSGTYRWNFPNGHYSLIGLSIWNIMNRDNPLRTYYERIANTPIAIDQLALGFTPNVSLQLQFYF